jgi:DNA-binding GntR family transcriptional regulator
MSSVARDMLTVMARFREIPRQLLRDDVYVQLQTAIVSGRLAPGERIRDLDLAKELGVSRTPVREALKRLEDDGLVESTAGVSTRVTPIDSRAGIEAAPVIAALHAVATRLGVPSLGRADLEALRAANRKLDDAVKRSQLAVAIGADDDFHAVLVRASGNRTLERAISGLRPAIMRLAYQRFIAAPGESSVAQHERIIAACAAGEAKRAAKLVESNWHNLAIAISSQEPDAAAA